MTKQKIEAVLDRVRTWPEDRRASLAHLALPIERRDSRVYELSDEERADLEEGIAEADRGEFASDEKVAALFDQYRR